MKKVLLINPSWPGQVSRQGKRFNRAWPPLSLMVCAAMLRERGCEVQIIDGRVQPGWRRQVNRIGHQYDWIVLTSSPMDRWQCPNLEVDHFIAVAQSFPSEKLIIVGAHGSLFPQAMLEQTGAAAVVVGEPEPAVVRLISEGDWSATPGVVFKPNNTVTSNGRAVPLNMAQAPVPAFDLIDFSRYYYELLGKRFALFESSRGCPYPCRFCLKVMFGDGVRFKPVGRLINEIDIAVTKFGVRTGYFIDLEFTMNRDRTVKICDRLSEQKYPFIWCCQTRADAVDAKLLSKMKQAGCRLIHFGVESGSEDVLRDTKKRVDLAAIRKGVRLTQEAGIDTACFFLFGLPGETPADMQKTISFAKTLNPTYASFHVVTPYPGTPLYKNAFSASSNAKSTPDFPLYCAEHNPLLLSEMTREAFKRFYLRPKYILSRITQGNISSWIRQLRLFGGFVA
ncbi:MAG: radical SAM protein [Desulfobacterales bacterium]|nr:MAG: radical SAM protein [Desulfobacterales bacterium]